MAPASPFAKQPGPSPRSLPTRDHADTDTETSPARKKVRLSEEADETTAVNEFAEVNEEQSIATGSSPGSSVTIAMDPPYSASYYADSTFAPLDEYRRAFLCRDLPQLQTVEDLSLWLDRHLRETDEDSRAQRKARYSADIAFFDTLGDTLKALLNRSTLFNTRSASQRKVRQMMINIYQQVANLCCRLLPLLPGSLQGALSRRDSAQPSPKAPQEVPLFGYIDLLASLFRSGTRTTRCLIRDYDLSFDTLESKLQEEVVGQHELFAALIRSVAIISTKASIVKGAWMAATSGVAMLSSYTSWLTVKSNTGFPVKEVKELTQLVHSVVLPAICREKPSSFPSDILALCTDGLSRLFIDLCEDVDLESAISLYSIYVNSSEDPVLVGDAIKDDLASTLRVFCGDDAQVVMHLLRYSWTMQACKSYLLSDFMTTRTYGMKRMSETLVMAYREFAPKTATNELQLVLQYLIRSLRSNNLIDYIFSAKSHANLVNLSVDTVGFLAATSHYSNQDSNAIWQACTTSVEAQFVQASIKVLTAASRYIDTEQTLHLAAKYTEVSLYSLDKALVALLPNLYQAISDAANKSPGLVSERSVLIPVKIARAAGARGPSDESSSASAVLDASLRYLTRYAAPQYTEKDRLIIYQKCSEDILGKTNEATSSIQIISRLFHQCRDGAVTDLLSPRSVIEEYCCFVDSFRSSDGVDVHNACLHRLRFIIQLAKAAPDGIAHEDTRTLLYACSVGPKALSGGSRDAAWNLLLEASTSDGLLHDCLSQYVPTLSSQLVTSRLLDLLETRLRQQIVEKCSNDFSQLPELPQWNQLGRIAAESDMHDISTRAAQIMSYAMYQFPTTLETFDTIKPSVIECQVTAARKEVDKLSGLDNPRDFARHMMALKGMLSLSLRMQATYAESTPHPHTIIVEGHGEHAENALKMPMRVRGRRDDMNLQVCRGSRLYDVNAALKNRFGVDCKVLFREQVLDLSTHISFEDAGLDTTGTLVVELIGCPEDDFDLLTASTTPVERGLSEQYSRLQAHLDSANEEVARETLDFLTRLRPYPSARDQILSAEAFAGNTVPSNRPYRTAHTMLLLNKHLETLEHTGAPDMTFKAKGLQLLLSFFASPGSHNELLTLRAVLALNNCLDAQDKGQSMLSQVETSTAFVSCLVATLQKALDGVHSEVRCKLAYDAYCTLLSACSMHTPVWEAFAQHPDSSLVQMRLLLDTDRNLASASGRHLNGFYSQSEVASDFADEVWRMLISVHGEAMEYSNAAPDYYYILANLVGRLKTLSSDQHKLRGLIESLSNKLFAVTHRETPEMPYQDSRIRGLLHLLTVVINLLEALGAPLELEWFSRTLFAQLLWPRIHDSASRPLISSESRTSAMALVQRTCKAEGTHLELIDIFQESIDSMSNIDAYKWPGSQDWNRLPGSNCGLSNLGQTCYMNSLLQQLYGNIGLRKLILNTPVDENPRHAVLRATQELFGEMQESLVPFANTEPLARVLNIQWDTQEDVHTFHSIFMTQLEDSMPDFETKAAFRKFFNGKALSQIRGSCGHVSETAEAFGDLSVVVKNKANLHDSVDEFMQGEPMAGDNQYKCYTCDEANGVFVDAMKRNCLAEIPDNLAVCLKRFQFDDYGNNTKLNDRFEFPEDIDMSVHKKSHLMSPEESHNPDVFRLVGVIVHLGSLDFGHYWSYVRLRGTPAHLQDRWVRLEDRSASLSSLEDVQAQCFGDGTGTDSAYVLFYQRISSIESARELVTKSSAGDFAPPHVQVLPEITQRIVLNNRLRQRVAHLHDPSTVDFLSFAIQSLGSEPDAADEYSILQSKVAHMVTIYIMQVQLTDSLYSNAEPIFEAIAAKAIANPMFAHHVIRSVERRGIDMARILEHDSFAVRELVYKLILTCLGAVRQQYPVMYGIYNEGNNHMLSDDGDFGSIVKAHASSFPLLKRLPYWKVYFGFAGRLAHIGTNETAIVLDHGLLDQCFDLLYTPFDPYLRAEYTDLHNYIYRGDGTLSAVYDFLAQVLGERVDLSNLSPEDATPDREPHRQRPKGCILRRGEINRLAASNTNRHAVEGYVVSRGFTACAEATNWQYYSPGKLFGVLTHPNVDSRLRGFMVESLVERYKTWDQVLAPLLHYTLHYCKANEDHADVRALLAEVARQFPLWEKFELDLVAFIGNVVRFSPCSTLWTFPPLMAELLLPSKAKPSTRRDVESWFKIHLFDPPILTIAPTASPVVATNSDVDIETSVASREIGSPLDIARVRATRYLVEKCSGFLADAYRQNYLARTKYDQMIDAMQEAKSYLDRLMAEVEKQKLQGAELHTSFQIEADEARRSQGIVNRLLTSLRDWEPIEEDETVAYGLPGGGGGGGGVVETVESDDESAFGSEDTGFTDEMP